MSAEETIAKLVQEAITLAVVVMQPNALSLDAQHLEDWDMMLARRELQRQSSQLLQDLKRRGKQATDQLMHWLPAALPNRVTLSNTVEFHYQGFELVLQQDGSYYKYYAQHGILWPARVVLTQHGYFLHKPADKAGDPSAWRWERQTNQVFPLQSLFTRPPEAWQR